MELTVAEGESWKQSERRVEGRELTTQKTSAEETTYELSV